MIRLKDILLVEQTSKEFERVKLKYKFDSLEPSFDEETMKTHYNKHYKGYTDKLNEAIKEENIPVVQGPGMESIKTILANVSQYSDKLRNNAGGYFNHSLFFNNLMPESQGCHGELERLITEQYGDCDTFIEQFSEAAKNKFGSGWCWLIYKNGQLKITTTTNQDNPAMNVVQDGGSILIALDLWEHSYYLKYKNQRDKYIKAFWKVLCWSTAEERLQRVLNS